VVIDLLDNASV